MAKFDLDIDPRTKLGGEVEWESGDDFDNFVRALNSGAVVRTDGVPGETGAPADLSLDATAQLELRSILARYQ